VDDESEDEEDAEAEEGVEEVDDRSTIHMCTIKTRDEDDAETGS
jgi:hypothetical protein